MLLPTGKSPQIGNEKILANVSHHYDIQWNYDYELQGTIEPEVAIDARQQQQFHLVVALIT